MSSEKKGFGLFGNVGSKLRSLGETFSTSLSFANNPTEKEAVVEKEEGLREKKNFLFFRFVSLILKLWNNF